MPAEAITIIDEAIAAGRGGEEIVQELEGAGIKLDYSQAEGEEALEGEEAIEGEEIPEGMEEVMGPPGEEMPEEGAPFEPQPGGPEGGMRDLRISAVRFALNKEKENKKKASEEAYE